jgi:hypothetical protein
LPLIRHEYNQQVNDALLRLATTAGEAQSVIESLIDQLAERCVETSRSGVISLDRRTLALETRYLVRELMKSVWCRAGWSQQAMGFTEWDRLAELVFDTDGDRRLDMPGKIAVARTGQKITLAPPK